MVQPKIGLIVFLLISPLFYLTASFCKRRKAVFLVGVYSRAFELAAVEEGLVKRSLLFFLISATTLFAADRSFDTWSQYLGGADSSQYSSVKQINKTNVKQLQVSWTYQTGGGSLLFDPLVVDGTMYIAKAGPTGTSVIVALDGATGKELWTHTNQGGVATRGMNYWESKDRRDRRLVYINAGFITELSAFTGETIQSFGESGRVDPRIGDRTVKIGRASCRERV